MPFRPWEGDHYKGGSFFGQKILLIGESHYDPEMRDHAEFTKKTVREVCNGNPIGFFTAVGHACVGPTAYEPARFWHSVAFFNFVETHVGPTSKARPTPAMWKEAKETFLFRAEALKPDRIIVFSDGAWNHLPPFADQTDGANFYAAEPSKAWMGYYRFASSLVPAMYAHHPNARGWSAPIWRALILRFLTEPLPEVRAPDAATQRKLGRRSHNRRRTGS